MNTRFLMLGAVAVGCTMAFTLPPRAAAVTDEEFNALKAKVNESDAKVEKLEQQLMEKQTAPSSGVQPIHPVPGGTVSATHDFLVTGDAEVQYVKTDGENGSFLLSDFAPIFLFRASENVLFEAGFDVTLQNQDSGGSSTSIDLSFAQLDYLLNDYMTLVAGYMVLPLGTYSERAAGWLNKLPDDPLPRSVLPGSGAGVQLRGNVPVGQSGQSVSYAVYVANGPGSVDGTGNAAQTNGDPNLDLDGNVGVKSDGTTENLHGNPSVGGRVGWFMPWKAHYDLELGVSGQSGEWDNDGKEDWQAGVIDAALHLGSLEVKGEYIYTWEQTADQGTLEPQGWWVQAAYNLAGLDLDLPVVNSLELVGRVDHSEDGLGTHVDRETAGILYHLTSTLQAEGAYEFMDSNDPAQDNNQFVAQLSVGF